MTRRTLAGVLALVAVAASACGSRVRDWPDDAAFATETTVHLTASEDGTDTGGSTAVTSRSQTASGRSSGGGGGERAATGALPAPTPGRYTYDDTAESPATDEDPAETTKAVTTAVWKVTRSSDTVASEVTETGKSDDPDDEGFTLVTNLRTTASALLVVSTTTGTGEDAQKCSFDPPLRELSLPLKTGTTWNDKSSCTNSDGDKESFSVSGRVAEEMTDTIGGVAVRTFVVKTTTTTTETIGGDEDPDAYGGGGPPETFTFTYTRTSHIDPKTLLVVFEDREYSIKFGDEPPDSTFKYHRRLRSLTPA